MKKKNGFTLIELLAIIVILAIIAVITIPIILGIIDDAKKGTVEDSAYGYKDAVNKWYVQKLLDNQDLKLNGVYTVTNGALDGENVDNDEIPISGSIPKSGYLTYENNILTEGCLTIDEYAITFENEKISSTEKGECKNPDDLPCPGPDCVYAFYTTSKNFGPNGTGSVLTEYTEDYTTLNKNYFLGHILDNNQKIEQAFVCGLNDGKIFCVEGDGAKYEKNKKIIKEVFKDLTFYENRADTDNKNGCFFDNELVREEFGPAESSGCTYNYVNQYNFSFSYIESSGLTSIGIYGRDCTIFPQKNMQCWD